MPIFFRWLLRLGPANPIAVRLVQNASRRTKHLYIRSAYLAVLILVLLWTMLGNTSAGAVSHRELASSGATSFAWIAYLQVALICILAPVFMAGAIAQEANPKTWDILLTTPMSRLEIVLGNLFGRLFFVLALLFASLPLFALTQFFGGVPGESIIASHLVAAGAAVIVGALAIALSVSRLVGQKAVFTFYISVVSHLAITIAIDAWLRSRAMGAGVNGNGVTWITAFNPFLALRSLLSPTAYPAATAGSYGGLKGLILERPALAWNLGSLALSALLVLASTLTVRSGGLRQITNQRTVKRPWYRKMLGLPGVDEEHRAPRSVWANPIAWREAASRNATFGRILARWSFIALGALVAVAIVVLYHFGAISMNDYQFIIRSVVFTEVFVIALVGVNMAATAISGEREDGTLDLILTTPITPGMYLAGKLRGLVSYLLPLIAIPVFTVGIAGLYSLFGGFGKSNLAEYTSTLPSGSTITVPTVLPEAGLLAAVVLVPFIAFCVMIGLHWSLKSKGTLSSVIGTVAVVGVVSGILGLCGWASGADMPGIGPALAALSPASLLDATIAPVTRLEETVTTGPGGLTAARIAMGIGAIVSAAIYIGITFGVRSALTRNFDVTVRKLAGTSEMAFRRFFQQRAKHPMLELVRDKRAMRAASDSLASKKAALQIGMLSERKIRKLVQQLKRDAGSFSNTAAMLERQGQLAEPALLEALADPKFLGFGAATDHALDDSPAETAINLLADCGTARSLPALRRFFHDEDLRRDALRVFATLCSADDAPELDRLLKELNEKDRSSVYSGIQNRFYKNKASDPLRSALLGVFSEYATATDGSPDFEALKSIGSIDSDVLLGLLDTEEMLFGEKFRQRKTLILLEDFHLHPSERFRERLLTDPEAQPNRDRVLCVLADPEPNKIWLDVFEHTLARMEIGDKDVSTYVMEEAVARMFRVDHWTSLFTECDPGEASPVQRDLSLLYELDRQVCNGGFLQYFFNESGPKWGATLEACDAIGLLDIRQLLEAAIRIIGLGDSDISNDSIHNRISKLTEAQESELNEADSAYYKINKYLSAKSILCILKHRAHFMNR